MSKQKFDAILESVRAERRKLKTKAAKDPLPENTPLVAMVPPQEIILAVHTNPQRVLPVRMVGQ